MVVKPPPKLGHDPLKGGHDQVCYGPVWFDTDGRRRPFGASTALCNADPPITGKSKTLSTHEAWVTCPHCLLQLAQRAAVAVPAAGAKVVDGGPEGPGGLGAGPLTPKRGI